MHVSTHTTHTKKAKAKPLTAIQMVMPTQLTGQPVHY